MNEILIAYIVAVFVLIVTPGPVVALVIRNASFYGFKAAFFTNLGTNFASLLLIAFAIAVILGAFSISPFVLSLLSIVGCVFIFYLGSHSLYATFKNPQPSKEQDLPTHKHNAPHKSLASYFLEGFGIAIANPKDIIFFVAFFPQFIHISDSITMSLSMLVMIWIVLDFCILMSYAIVMQRAIFLRYKKHIGIMSDVILICIGVFGIFYLLQSLELI